MKLLKGLKWVSTCLLHGIVISVCVICCQKVMLLFLTSHVFGTDTTVAVIALIAGAGVAALVFVAWHVVVVRRVEKGASFRQLLLDRALDQHRFDSIKIKGLDSKNTSLQNQLNALKGAEKRRVKALGECSVVKYNGEFAVVTDYAPIEVSTPWHSSKAKAKSVFGRAMASVEGRKAIDWGKE